MTDFDSIEKEVIKGIEWWWVKSFAVFWFLQAQLGSSECFFQSCENVESHWTMRCWTHLIVSKSYLLDLSLCLGASDQNPWFWAYLTFADYQSSCTTWLLYRDQPPLHLLYNKWFFIASEVTWCSLNSGSRSSYIRLHCMFIYAAFKSHAEGSKVQCIGTPLTTILPTTAGIYNGLNYFSHMI